MTARPGEKQGGWWNRNWYWALPGGCLGCLALPLGACVVLLGGMLGAVRTSGGFQDALAQIQSHPEVVAALGEPIEAGWFFRGSINISDSTKTVDVSVPISGPDGAGTLYVEGEETAGVWRFERLEVELDNGDWIDLLASPAPSGTPGPN